MINKKEILEKVKTHLQQQNCRAFENKFCRYKTSDGKKCAIGCLIPDNIYDSEIEGCDLKCFNIYVYDSEIEGCDLKCLNIDETKRSYQKLKNILCQSLGVQSLNEEEIDFLLDLQIIHDQEYFLENSDLIFQSIERKYNIC